MHRQLTCRHFLLPLFTAVVGFSAALATSRGTDDPGQAEMRGIGSSFLLFTTPLVNFPDGNADRDLGDVDLVSAISRYAHVKGGVPRYAFSTTELPGQFSLGLTPAGNIFGTPAAPGGATALRFQITARDGLGTNPNIITDSFRLSVVPAGQFKFAHNQLAQGMQYRSYIEKLEVLGGFTPYRFSLVDIVLNGTPLNSLRGTGLELDPNDGTLFGKPIVNGVLTFTAVCVDPNATPAASRLDPTVRDQAFTLLIEPNRVVHSEVIFSKISIKGSSQLGGKDSLSVSGNLNLAGYKLSDFANTGIEFRIGTYDTTLLPAIFDAKGKAKFQASRASPGISASISTKGTFKLSIKGEGFGKDGALGDLTQSKTVLPLQLRIGTRIIGSETLELPTRTAGSLFKLSYKLGNGNPGGAFMLTKVSGSDSTFNGAPADKWQASVIAIVPKAISAAGASEVVTSVGRSFESPRGKVSFSKSKLSASGSKTRVALTMDVAKGKGTIKTNTLLSDQTDINQAKRSGTTASSFSVRFQTFSGNTEVFGGEDSMVIKPKSSKWSAP